jgi:hypothetical protein
MHTRYHPPTPPPPPPTHPPTHPPARPPHLVLAATHRHRLKGGHGCRHGAQHQRAQLVGAEQGHIRGQVIAGLRRGGGGEGMEGVLGGCGSGVGLGVGVCPNMYARGAQENSAQFVSTARNSDMLDPGCLHTMYTDASREAAINC